MQLEDEEARTKVVIPESVRKLTSDDAGLSPSSSTVVIYNFFFYYCIRLAHHSARWPNLFLEKCTYNYTFLWNKSFFLLNNEYKTPPLLFNIHI